MQSAYLLLLFCILVAAQKRTIMQWGNTFVPNNQKNPEQVIFLPPIKQVSVGFAHTLHLAENGSVYCHGLNRWAQCGIKLEQSEIVHATIVLGETIPTPVLSRPKQVPLVKKMVTTFFA